MIYTGLVFFMVGVIVAALANNFTTLLVGRSIQGIGGGGLIALTEIVVTDLVPMRFRGQWFGIISGMWAIGSVSGPVIGGALSQNASWVRKSQINVETRATQPNKSLEMDLLDQLAIHWYCLCLCPSLSQAQFQADEID